MKKRDIFIVVLVVILVVVYFVTKSPATGDVPQEQGNVNVPTSADNAPPGSIHNLPVPEAVSVVRALVAEELGISEGLVIAMTVYEREWPNGCLGLAEEGEFCIQVITPGYEVTVQAQGAQFVYRTNREGSVLRFQE